MDSARMIVLVGFVAFAPCAVSSCAPGPACELADASIDAEAPKPIDAFIACDTFDDLVQRNAARWGCGMALPECPWPRALDVRCDPAAVLETLAVARGGVTDCAELLSAIDPDACR